MFDFSDTVISKILNPLEITKNSIIEFSAGPLANTGLYRFDKIVEFNFGDKSFAKYVIYSKVEETEYIFEVLKGNSGQLETYIYTLIDSIPFSEEFLEVVGQRYITTPQGNEFERCIEAAEEITDGALGKVKIYNIEIDEIEKEYEVKVWDYQRQVPGGKEYLNIEMSLENGMFKIFTGELIEDIFYKFYQSPKVH